MRTALALTIGVVAAATGGAQADELDGWCAQVKKASSIVTCLDSELRGQVIYRNKLFETAQQRLSNADYKAMTQDQNRWVKSYTARCGISVDGTVPLSPIPQTVIDCYRRESRARTAYLEQRLSGQSGAAAPSVASPSEPGPNIFDQFDKDHSTPPTVSRQKVIDALVAVGIPRPQAETGQAWHECTEAAADKFAEQPEPARVVAEAALAFCTAEESKYLIAAGHSSVPASQALRESATPDLLARIMATRTARAKGHKQNESPSPAIDYNRM